jgi:uncharacterized protein YabE (DUF348 family)
MMNDESFLWLLHHSDLVAVGVAALVVAALTTGVAWGRRAERAHWHRTIRAAAARGPKVQDPDLIAVVEGAGVTISDKAPDDAPRKS